MIVKLPATFCFSSLSLFILLLAIEIESNELWAAGKDVEQMTEKREGQEIKIRAK